jgi:signal transduction histidine kinase
MSQQSTTSSQPGNDSRPSLYARLLALVVRPTAPPLWLGIVVAAAFIVVETLLVYQLRRVASENAFGALFLLGVLVVSAGWGFWLAVATSLASALVYVYFHMETTGTFIPTHLQDAVAILIFLPVALLANVLAGQARLRAAESELRRREAEASHAKARALAEQQAALRRVATLVARGVDPAQVYPAAVTELSRGLGIDNVALLRYESGEALVLLAARDESELTKMSIGERIPLEDDDNVPAMILATGAPARMDCFDDATGPTAERIRRLGLRSAVGAPIIIDGRIWGALVIGSSLAEPLPPETEARIGDFADLVATAIANAETRAELTASRARIVTASDQTRRRFERDLHDGAQQRLVSLGLALRAVEAAIPAAHQQLRDQVSNVVEGLVGVSTELQQISRGIHPAILSKGGLGPAIKTLARRSAVPVALDLDVDRRMPESVEVAAYYVVAEALTNAAKHAQASEVKVAAVAADVELHLRISDDGIGGAVAGGGSGLIGLKDRVEALAGRLDISSPAGSGTTLTVVIPLQGE